MPLPEKNIPTILAAFGATGDLMRKKVIPSLFYLHEHKQLPDKFRVVGFSRRELDTRTFRAFVGDVLQAFRGSAVPDETLAPFLQLFEFQRGDFDEAGSYDQMKAMFDALDAEWGVCANKLFYLSVAPEFYSAIFRQLSRSKLSEPCGPDEGWTRVMIEKPFGLDGKTAAALEQLLEQYFNEHQICRIDHYLAKYIVRNLAALRLENDAFNSLLSAETVGRIEIDLFEEMGVEKRGAFYDPVGAFRDVGQNHFLELLALLCMERPQSHHGDTVREARARVLESLPVLSADRVRTATVRGQYDGYRTIPGVQPDSTTETYFSVEFALNDPKWRETQIRMRGGKRLGAPLKEIRVTLRPPAGKKCVVIALEPTEEILAEGLEHGAGEQTFRFAHRDASERVQYVEEYAQLILEAIRGDQTLFVSAREVAALWRFADPIIAAWKENAVPLAIYKPDTKDIVEGI